MFGKNIMRLCLVGCLVAASSVAFSSISFSQTNELSEDVAHGQALAKANCSRCHEIGITGESPHPKAPAFWAMFERREPSSVADMLLSKTSPKHTDMPTFTITEKQATDIGKWIAWVQPVAHGKRLVVENCSSCHAVTLNDESRHEEAPAFRDLGKYYPIESLEEAFAEGIESGHPDMPVFEVDIIQLQDILAYIASIQVE